MLRKHHGKRKLPYLASKFMHDWGRNSKQTVHQLWVNTSQTFRIISCTEHNARLLVKKITYSQSYLHPKLELWRGEKVSLLLAKGLAGANEGPGLVGGATLLIQTHHPLVALVRREVGSRRFSLKKAQRTLARLVEGWPWLPKAHVPLAGQLLLLVVVVEVVVAVHQRARALVVKHVLPRKPWLCARTRRDCTTNKTKMSVSYFLS